MCDRFLLSFSSIALPGPPNLTFLERNTLSREIPFVSTVSAVVQLPKKDFAILSLKYRPGKQIKFQFA